MAVDRPLVDSKSLGPGGVKTELDAEKVRQRLQAVKVASGRGLAIELYGGEGKLTRAVYADAFERVVVVEKDKEAFERLERATAELGQIELLNEDNVEVVTEGLVEYGAFDLVDFDAYGCPTLLVGALFEELAAAGEASPEEFVLCLTDGMLGLVKVRGRANFGRYYLAGPDEVRQADDGLWEGFEELQAEFVRKVAGQAGYDSEVINAVRNRERTALYSAYRLWKRQAAGESEEAQVASKMLRRELASKAVNEPARRVRGYFSTSEKDRENEVIEPAAFERTLDKYLDNPVVLVNHDPNRIAGKAVEVGVDEQGAFCVVEITSDEVWQEIEQGTLRGFSWQGMIEGYEWQHLEGEAVRVITDVDLWEITVTPLPVNPNCLFEVAEAESEPEGREEDFDLGGLETREAPKELELAGVASKGLQAGVEEGEEMEETQEAEVEVEPVALDAAAIVAALKASEEFQTWLRELVAQELDSIEAEVEEKDFEAEVEEGALGVEQVVELAVKAVREAARAKGAARKGLLDGSYDPYKREELEGLTTSQRLRALLALEA